MKKKRNFLYCTLVTSNLKTSLFDKSVKIVNRLIVVPFVDCTLKKRCVRQYLLLTRYTTIPSKHGNLDQQSVLIPRPSFETLPTDVLIFIAIYQESTSFQLDYAATSRGRHEQPSSEGELLIPIITLGIYRTLNGCVTLNVFNCYYQYPRFICLVRCSYAFSTLFNS